MSRSRWSNVLHSFTRNLLYRRVSIQRIATNSNTALNSLVRSRFADVKYKSHRERLPLIEN